MAEVLVNIDEPVKLHPLQINEFEGPKGAYEMKKIENGYYIRVDMPGLSRLQFRVKRVKEEKEFRFQGFARKVDNSLAMKDSNRFYAFTVKVNECQDFDRVVLDHQLLCGTCRILVTGVENASLLFRTPAPPKDSNISSEGGSSSSSSSQPENVIHRAGFYHPYSVRIDGVRAEELHSADCKCGCDGLGGKGFYTGPLKEEDGRIYGYVDPSKIGVFATEFKPVGDGSGDYYMYLRVDMPDCNDKSEEKFVYWIKSRSIDIICHANLSQFDDKFKLDEAGGRRTYSFRITFNCEENCCSFNKFPKQSFHLDGVFRTFIKINKRMIFKDDTPSDPTERPLPDPADDNDDSGPCSTTSSVLPASWSRHTRNK